MTIPGDVKHRENGTGSVAELLGWEKRRDYHGLPPIRQEEPNATTQATMDDIVNESEQDSGFANALGSPPDLPMNPVATAVPFASPTPVDISPNVGDPEQQDTSEAERERLKKQRECIVTVIVVIIFIIIGS